MRILVVEDEKKVSSFIKRGLEEEKFEVDVAADGEEGLKLALEKAYDLLVLDWMLPKRDGLSLLKELRDRRVSIPVLMLTAKDTVEDIVAGLESGSDDYLTKPFAFAELLARVKALIRRSEMDRGAELRFGDLKLDPVTHKVWRGDKEIDLTAKEYALLEYLAAHAGRVLSRTMIVEHVWDESFEGLTNIVDVYIRHLRSKIDDRFPVKLIHTVRGIGYMLDAPAGTPAA